MPDSRTGRAWITTLVALLALFAFAPQAGATDYEEDEPVVGCVATDYEHEDPCESDKPKPEPEPDEAKPEFVPRFISRVWKFVGEVDYYEDGELSMTLGKVLNLPRKLRSQDDELLDQDTTVLVGGRVRVFRDGKRVAREELDAANDVRVHGKLLRPRMWRVDDDGSPVPTIRAKKVYITG